MHCTISIVQIKISTNGSRKLQIIRRRYFTGVRRMTNQNDNKRKIPLLPLRGLGIFPYMVLHFDVGREKSIRALEEAMINDQLIFLVTQKEAQTDLPSIEDFYEVGTISKIKQLLKLPGDTIRVLVEGISRARIEEIVSEEQFF
ncbi:MAG: endopeptidase La, partial [Clostridia bacterium]|nr:endopeptidase La [Clostridia bacterium]